jgi:predicted transcriptional regulator
MDQVILPASSLATQRASILVILDDEKALTHLINQLLDRAGLSQAEVARRLGISKQGISQYRSLRRKKPSLQWFTKMVQVCGGRLSVDFPPVKLME